VRRLSVQGTSLHVYIRLPHFAHIYPSSTYYYNLLFHSHTIYNYIHSFLPYTFHAPFLNHFTTSTSTKQFLNCTYSTGQFFASIFLQHLFFGFVCLNYRVYFTGHFLEQPFCVGVWVTLGNCLEVATVV